MSKVSVIVCCWNHCEDLTKPFVKNFMDMTNVGDLQVELILFDNGSTDNTWKYLKTVGFDDCIKVVHSDTNLGFGGGNNEALKHAEGKYVLFLNNDVILKQNNWLDVMISEMEKFPKSVIGAEFVSGNSTTEFRGKMRDYINGWCLMIPREFLDKHGAFDKDFGWAYFEDVFLCQKAVENGYKLRKVNTFVEHLGSRSSVDQLNIDEQHKLNKAVYISLMYKLTLKDKKRIVFYVSNVYPFIDSDYEGKGVGGAEASLIQLTRELSKQGFLVDIYNDTALEGEFNGVHYWNCGHYSPFEYCDIFILYRNSYADIAMVNSPCKIFWSCDQETTRDWESSIIPFVDHTIAISEYHKGYLYGHYPFPRGSISVLDLGIKTKDYIDLSEKVPGKLIFCSVPRRGLSYLATLFPRIKELVPEAELFVTSDYRLWGAGPENQEFVDQFSSMPGVHFLGMISRKELVEHQKTSMIMAYPCAYDENFCISAMECIAAGTVPITSNIGALPTTVGESGIVIPHHPSDPKFSDIFIEWAVKLLKDESVRNQFVFDGRKRALEKYGWDNLAKVWADKFLAILNSVMEKYQPLKCKHCGEVFENSFGLFKHTSSVHKISIEASIPRKKLEVYLKTSKRIELSVNGNNWNGTELRVPQDQSGDIIRILTEAYGPGIVVESRIERSVDNPAS